MLPVNDACLCQNSSGSLLNTSALPYTGTEYPFNFVCTLHLFIYGDGRILTVRHQNHCRVCWKSGMCRSVWWRILKIFSLRCLTAATAVPSLHSNFNCVVTVSKCFPSVGFGRFCRKTFSVRFRFRDKHVVNFFTTRVIWHDFHHH